MKYIIGVDLGTSAVKTILVNERGEVCAETSKSYSLIQEMVGHSEQKPEEWVQKTLSALEELVSKSGIHSGDIEGLSYSGQMHGLVLLDKNHQVLRNAILWNDTRTTQQCKRMTKEFGDQILDISKNKVLEGFTLPKILWVQEHEPEIFEATAAFMLPKDYLRFRMTGVMNSEYSDAAGTLLLNLTEKKWSTEICAKFDIPEKICPPLVESHECVGTLLSEVLVATGLSEKTKVFAGGADNACGAIGAGILSSGKTLCSIGTSGVILSYEEDKERNFKGKVHFFNHGKKDSFYTMGVTLAAGYSLTWFKDTFCKNETFEEMLEGVGNVQPGANGLLFTPYLVGERTPHPDSLIRGSFIGMDSRHKREHFVRAVMEGITFSLQESISIFREEGIEVDTVISIGGGAKSETWLQMQADIFNAKVIKLDTEQGPALGAAMLAAVGSNWFETLEECAMKFIRNTEAYYPIEKHVKEYHSLFTIYQDIYSKTKELNESLSEFRKQ